MLQIKHFTCCLHSLHLPEKQKKRHCAKRKAKLYLYWLTLPANEPSSGESSSFSSSSEFISKFDSMQLHNEWKSNNSIFGQRGKKELRGQSVLRKQQNLCNIAEFETLKNYLSLSEYFQMYHVFLRKNEKIETKPLTYSQVTSPGSSDPGQRKSAWWNHARIWTQHYCYLLLLRPITTWNYRLLLVPTLTTY